MPNVFLSRGFKTTCRQHLRSVSEQEEPERTLVIIKITFRFKAINCGDNKELYKRHISKTLVQRFKELSVTWIGLCINEMCINIKFSNIRCVAANGRKRRRRALEDLAIDVEISNVT